MEKMINDIRERSSLLCAYASILEDLEHKEKWYQHKKTTTDRETGEEIEMEEWEDDDGEYASANLSAIRNVANAIRKLAGV